MTKSAFLNESESETMINMNQSELSRRGPSLLEDEFDIKNCLVDLSAQKQVGLGRKIASKKDKMNGSDLIDLHNFAQEESVYHR